MYIEQYKNNGIPYLRLVESRYNPEPGKGAKKIVIKSIGPLSRFDDGQPDYVKRLKESFKNKKPLIESLNEYCTPQKVYEKYKIEINEGSDECVGHPRLYSHMLLEKYLEELGIVSFINRYKQLTKIEFDVLGFTRLLIYGRLLNPSSKIGTTNQNNDYYNPILKEGFNKYNVYDTLDFIYDHKDKITNKINKILTDKFNRTTNVIYYDVTNFFFEIESPDEDTFDNDGNVLEIGTRKLGVSKEKRKQPIVQMGLFMDEQGVPISIKTFPGNTLDHLTVIPSIEQTIDTLNVDRFIFVGDRGMYRGNNSFHLTNKNNGYIISKSIEKTTKSEKEWMFNQDGYLHTSTAFKYKSRIITRTVKLENDTTTTITEKVVVYWSEKFQNKQLAENKSLLDFLSKFEENPSSFRFSNIKSSYKKFFKKECLNESTGEVLQTKDLSSILDYEKINKFKDSFGYYQLVTSELNMDDKTVIDTYHGLTRIEDQFRVMKGNLDVRPIYVRTKEHIESHLYICMLSLIIMRLIQNKIVSFQKKNNLIDTSKNWTMGLSADRLIKALNRWNVDALSADYFRFNDIDIPDLKLILDSFNINIPKKLFSRMELKNLKTNINLK